MGDEQDGENKYDALLREQPDPTRDALNLSRRASYGMDPAKSREVLGLNAQTGLPATHLERSLDPWYRDKLKDELSNERYDGILKNAPSTARWMADPFRLKAGQEDLDRLARIEGVLRERSKPKPASDKDIDVWARANIKDRVDRGWAAIQKEKADPLFGVAPTGGGAFEADPELFGILAATSRQDVEDHLIKAERARLKNEDAFRSGTEDKLPMWARLGTAITMGLRHGARTNERGRIGVKMQSGDKSAETLAALEVVERDLATTPYGGSFAARWLYTPAQTLGQMIESMSASTKRAYQGAAAGATAAAIAGQAGPQIAIPEEVVTVPATALAGGIAGFSAGMAEQSYIIEAGNAYLDLEKIRGKNGEQIPEGVKQAASAGIGIINAAIEMASFKVLAGPAKAVVKKFFGEAIKDTIETQTVKRALVEFTKNYAKAVGSETGTEPLQEVVGIVGEEIAKMATKGDFETFANSPEARAAAVARVLDVAGQTFRGMAVIGLAGPVVKLGSDVAQVKAQERQAKAVEFYEQLKAIEKEVTESELAKENVNEIEAIAADTKQEPTWLPALAAQEYYSQKGLDPAAEIASITGDTKAFEEAIGRQGDIAIPAEKYISISQGEHKAFFQENLRHAPDEMNYAETKAAVDEQRAEEKRRETAPALPKSLSEDRGGLSPDEVSKLIERQHEDTQKYVEALPDGRYVLTYQDGTKRAVQVQRNKSGTIQNVYTDSGEGIDLARELLPQREQDGTYSKPPTIANEQQHKREVKETSKAVDSARKIGDQVVQALEVAGFKNEAKRLGIVAQQLFKRLGERTGKDPLEIFNRYGLQIQRAEEGAAAGGPSMNQPAFHGSPHKFEKFTTQKIGTGEGAQAYGWGLYFAGNKEVAKFYRDALSRGEVLTVKSAGQIVAQGDSIDAIGLEAIRLLEIGAERAGQFKHNAAYYAKQMTQDENVLKRIDEWRDAKIGYEKIKGRLYQVDIPDDSDYLDWDKPMSQQSDKVVKAIESMKIEMVEKWKASGAWPHVTGGTLYKYLAEGNTFGAVKEGKPEAASKALLAAGIPGLTYKDQGSRGTAGGTNNYVVFDENAVKITSYEQPAESGGARGRIVIGKSSLSIDLFEKADKSTFLHEIGHFYLEVIQDLVSQPKPDASLVADFQAIRDWMGLKEGEAITEKEHEKFARAFELYLQEGKAPSKALRKAFYQFRRWLIDIYKEVKDYFTGVELTPQIKGVLDRMLASEDEIFAARMESGGSVFDGPAGDILTPEQRIRLEAAQQEAVQEAEETLTVSMMQEVAREEEADWKEQKAALKAEELANLQKQPVYRALHALTTKDVGGVEGSPEWTGKLQRDAVDPVFTALPKGITAEHGAHPDVVADWFGFKDGHDLLYALAGAEDIDALADRQADERMLALYPRMTAEELHAKAIEALHGTKNKALRALEMNILAESAAGKKAVRDLAFYRPRIEVVQGEAARDVESVKVGELRPHAYHAAEIRNAKECLKLAQKGDIKGALDAKLREIMNAERYAAAVEARDGVKAFIKETRKMARSDEKLSKTRDVDLVNAARAVLAKWGVGRFKGEPSDFLGQVKSNDPVAYEAIMADVTEAIRDARPYKEATYREFLRMKEAVEALWSVAKDSMEMEVEGKKVDAATAREALGTAMDAIPANYANYGKRGKPGLWEKFRVGLLSIKAAGRRVESWADAMGPAFTKYVWNPVNDAIIGYRNQRIETLKKYRDAVMARPEIFKAQRIEATELDGYVFESKAHLLGALLHAGNSSNLMKLIVGRKWGEYDPETESFDTTKWDAFLKRMEDDGVITKADWEFCQAVWDLNESIKPLAQRAHKEMYGRYFSEVTAEPVATRWGTFKGGYVPAVVDPEVYSGLEDKKARERDAGFNAEYAMPMTTKGFTMARSKGFAEALTMDLRMIPRHIDEVLRFAYIQPRVNEVKRLITHKDVAGQLQGIDKKALHGMLMPWLDRAVKQRAEATGWIPSVDRFWRAVRKNVGMQLMAWNITNAAQNLTGLSVALTKVKAHHLRNATVAWMRGPKDFTGNILELSDYMRQTLTSESSDLIDDINDVITNPNAFQKFQAWGQRHAQILQRMTQNPVSLITWQGAYEQAMERLDGNDEAAINQAVREADAAVRLTQGAQGPENIARFEAGTPFFRALTQFTGYFGNKANLMGTEFEKTIRELGLKKGAGRLLGTFFLGHAAPAIIGYSILKTLAGTWSDEDDDGYLDEVLGALFGSQFREATGYFPFVGNAVNLAVESFGGGSYNDRVMNSPAITLLEKAVKLPAAVYDTIEGDLKKKVVQDTLMILGAMTGTPASAIGRPVGYLMDVEEGKAEPSGPIDFARGLLTGKRGE